MKAFLRKMLALWVFLLVAACGGGGGGSSAPPSDLTPTEAVAQAADALTFATIAGGNTSPTLIVSDLVLPATGLHGTLISWSTSDAQLVETSGSVHRPAQNVGNLPAVLTARLSLQDASQQVVFNLVVLADPSIFSHSYSGSGYDIDQLDTPLTDSADSQVRYQLDLGSATRDVYLVFTNTSLLDATAPPLLANLFPVDRMARARQLGARMSDWARTHGIGLSDRPDVSLFNSDPELYGGVSYEIASSAPSRALAGTASAPLLDSIGETSSFFLNLDGSQSIAATCREVLTADGKTLNIWVANDSWQGLGCTKAHCVDQSMVDALGDKFLSAGSNNDIYEWVTNIYGAEWGPHPFSNLISADDNITILLYDIDADNSTTGGVLGFFFNKDNFLSSGSNSIPGSNQRIMFYVDSVMFSTPDGVSWDLTDFWPNKLIGTLAHEFQHMINYYQKNILNSPASAETWLNEMCSMVTEDLVETKLQTEGPRGVSWTDGSAGASGNISGRLPRFVRFDYLPVAQWFDGAVSDPGDTNVLNSYSLNYAYGAYLARNFGGPALFRAIVQNDLNGGDAITAALSAQGYGEDFAATLRDWGAAVLLSDDATDAVPAGSRYNRGGFSSSLLGSISYDLGSINMYNYSYPGQAGPRIYTSLPPSDANAGIYKTSNLYYRLGSGLSGQVTRNITLRKGTKLTVVIR